MSHTPEKTRDRHVLIESKTGYLAVRCVCKARYLFFLSHDDSMKGFARWRAKERRACFVDASGLDLFVCRCGYAIIDERPVDSMMVH